VLAAWAALSAPARGRFERDAHAATELQTAARELARVQERIRAITAGVVRGRRRLTLPQVTAPTAATGAGAHE
jgi:hypothetical protein